MITKKKFHHLSAGAIAGTVPHYGKSSPSYRITFIKRLDVDLRWELLKQKLSISPGLYTHLNWLAKTELRGVWSSVLLLITVASEKCWKKLKLKKQKAFLSRFCHWWHFNWRGGGCGRTPSPPGYAYVLGSFVLEMRKLLATSEAEFNSSVSAARASERKCSRGYEGRYRAPNCIRPPSLIGGLMPLNHFLLHGRKSSFKSEGITIFAYSQDLWKTQLHIRLV